ncbi:MULTISPECIES: hypothetical protein [unclassified Halomonas]|uniref:hypothetical protein n=1 Tax=unclassified Halomonas TaxID=2609666 RepID=UPI0018689F47|nr:MULTISPECIES: hypothetical protein [unclassified Halomonas]
MRENAPVSATPDGSGQHQATLPAARAETPTEPADMPFSAITFAADLASWLKNDDLAPWLRLEGYDPRQADWIKAFQEQPSDGRSRSRLTYQPEGVDAIPQTYADVRPLKRQLAQDVSRLTRDYNAALDVDIVKTAPSPHTQGTEYTVHVTGFDGFVEAVLEATGLPFTHGQLTPEQIQALDPWRSLKYWLAADLFAPSPLVLSLSVNADMEAPGSPTPAAQFHQVVLSPVAFGDNRREAALLAFTPLEHYLWYLGGQHLPDMGLKAPHAPFELEGQRHKTSKIPSFRQPIYHDHLGRLDTYRAVRAGDASAMTASFHRRALTWFQVDRYRPDLGQAVFTFTVPAQHPRITDVSAAFEHVRVDDLMPVRNNWIGRGDVRRDHSKRDIGIARYGRFF